MNEVSIYHKKLETRTIKTPNKIEKISNTDKSRN